MLLSAPSLPKSQAAPDVGIGNLDVEFALDRQLPFGVAPLFSGQVRPAGHPVRSSAFPELILLDGGE